MLRINPPGWIYLGDPYDYLHQSKIPLSEKNFYFPQKTENFYPRPFTVPLFYKIAHSNPETIIILQIFLHVLSAFFLCCVVLLFLKKAHTKILFIFFWYLLMSWWNIIGWDHTLLSESLSISFMFIWLASFLLYLNKRTVLYFILHLIVILLFSFTRDSWPYVFVLFYSLVALLAVFYNRKMIKINLSLLIASISLFIIQQKSAEAGQRYMLPILNNIVMRILPNDKYLQWFADRGMPCISQLKEKYSNLSDFKLIYPLYKDTAFNPLFEWIAKDGRNIFTKFLITHPRHMFLLNEKPEDINRIFSYNLNYTGNTHGYHNIVNPIFPLFNALVVIILNCFCIFMFFKEKRFVLTIPTVIILIFTFNAVLLYNADALEVDRHLFITNIIIQFVGILLVCFILDSETFNRYFKTLSNPLTKRFH